MKRTFYFILPLLLITIFGLSVLHVVIANMLSTAGVELDKLQVELVAYQKENTIIREQILNQTSLDHIASVASNMGFIEAKSNVYIDSPLPLAKR